MPFLTPFLGEGSPTKIDKKEKGHPCSNLSTGGPRLEAANLGIDAGSLITLAPMKTPRDRQANARAKDGQRYGCGSKPFWDPILG